MRKNNKYMKKNKSSSLSFILMLLISMSFVCICGCMDDNSNQLVSNQLVIPGTGACEDILRILAATFNESNPDYEVIIPPSTGSSGGIRSTGNDESIIGRVARAIQEDEAGYGLSYLIFAKDMVVFGVSSNIEVNDLTTTQLIDIFSGIIKNWNETEGNNSNINVFIREESDSSLKIIEEHIPSFKNLEFAENAQTFYHNYEMTNALETFPNSIGWLTGSDLIYTENITAVSIDDIAPSKKNIQEGKYNLTGDYAFVYKEGQLNKIANMFLDFVFSDNGKQIIEAAGLIAIDR
jgi:phosphate transport system substrate-binding protein